MNSNHELELRWLAEIAKHIPVRSYLEVGCRNGLSIQALERHGAFQPGATIVAVDLPGGPWGKPGTEKGLMTVGERLRDKGYHVHIHFGNSHSQIIVDLVREHSRFDLCYIDADHTFKGVSKDFKNYEPMARCVALDDIAAVGEKVGGGRMGVHELWRGIRKDPRFITVSSIANDPGSSPQGIGVAVRRSELSLSSEDMDILKYFGESS